MIGYIPEYRVAAQLIYSALKNDDLVRFWKGDPLAGKVDDLVIESRKRFDAYQIKWTQGTQRLSFNELIKSTADSSSLVAQLATGWKAGRSNHTGKSYYVHLLSPKPASLHATIPTDPTNIPHDPTLRGFIQGISALGFDSAGPWAKAFSAFSSETNLSDDELAEFLSHCCFDLGYTRPLDRGTSPDEQVGIRDTKQIAELLRELKVSEQIATLTRGELVARLGWTSRFKFRSRHDYPLPSLYSPIGTTFDLLQKAVADFQSGYLALVGSPGSGKSTLLSHALEDSGHRVIRYYAFVPGSSDNLVLRGESTSFYHDILLTLKEQHLYQGATLIPTDRAELINEFDLALKKLHEDWKVTGKKTVFVIDGIDHIEREQRPQWSLLNDLPSANTVPDGVMIILGSQPYQIDLLRPDIRVSANELGRKIQIQALDKTNINAMLNELDSEVGEDADLKELIYQKCGGHPLGFQLIINVIRSSTESSRTIIKDFPDFGSEIDVLYEGQWTRVTAIDGMPYLLAQLCRLSGPINLKWIRTWDASFSFRALVERFRREFNYLFTIESENRWYFFHNSFRVFLQRKSLSGQQGDDFDRELHANLAQRCLETDGTPDGWQHVYHLLASGQEDAVLSRVDSEYFRKQFFAYRHLSPILSEIRSCMRVALKKLSLERYIEYQLVGTEMESRGEYVADDKVVSALIRLKEIDRALHYIRSGHTLHVSYSNALRSVPMLLRYGLRTESYQLLQVADPRNELSRRFSSDGRRKTLKAWVRAIAVMGDTTRALRLIDEFVSDSNDYTHPGESAEKAKWHMKLSLCRWLLRQGNASFASELFEQAPTARDAFILAMWLARHILHHSLESGISIWYDRAAALLQQLGPDEHIEFAELTREIGFELAAVENILGKSSPEIPPRSDLYHVSGIGAYRSLSLFYELHTLLGHDVEDLKVVVRPKADYEEPAFCLESFIRDIAVMRGTTQRDATIRPSFRQICLQAENLFVNALSPNTGPTWHGIRRFIIDIVEELADVALQLGDVEEIRSLLVRQWDSPDGSTRWASDQKAAILACLSDTCVFTPSERDSLIEFAESELLNGVKHTYEKYDQLMERCEFWLDSADSNRASYFLQSALACTLAVHPRKDYQTNEWLKWLRESYEESDARFAEKIEWFADAITKLEDFTEGPAAARAAETLIEICAEWNPAAGVRLLEWFGSKEVINYPTAFTSLVTALSNEHSLPFGHLHVLLRDFVIAVRARPDDRIARSYIKKLDDSGQRSAALIEIARSCKVYEQLSEERTWSRTFADLLTGDPVWSEFAAKKKEREDDDSREIEQLRSKSSKELLDLLAEGTRWRVGSVLLERLEELTDDELKAASSVSGTELHFKASIARRLTEAGLSSEAWDGAKHVFLQADGYRWHEWSDGGSRKRAFETLCVLNYEGACRLLYDVVLSECRIDAVAMHDMLPHIFPNYSVGLVWPLIFNHLCLLFQKGPDSPALIGLSDLPVVGSRSQVQGLLCDFLNHPISEFSDQSNIALTNMLPLYEESDWRHLVSVLASNGTATERILCCFASALPDVVLPEFVNEQLRSTTGSSDLMICYWASYCLGTGLQVQASPRSVVSPGLADFQLPPIEENWREELTLNPNDALPSAISALDALRPYEYRVRILAKISGIPASNLAQMALAELIRLNGKSILLASSEEALRRKLSSIGLRRPYTRPRGQAARNALNVLANKLYVDGRLTYHSLKTLAALFVDYDPLAVRIELWPKPEAITEIEEYKSEADVRGWISATPDDCKAARPKQIGEFIVMAESVRFERVTHGYHCEELLMTQHGHADGEEIESEHFFDQTRISLADYSTISYDRATPSMVVKNSKFECWNAGIDWLAVLPSVARSHNLEIGPNPLEWIDKRGVAVRSMRWRKGPSSSEGQNYSSDCMGEGWILLLRNDLYEHILQDDLGLKFRVLIERSAATSGQSLSLSEVSASNNNPGIVSLS